jgi:hypothetical protein
MKKLTLLLLAFGVAFGAAAPLAAGQAAYTAEKRDSTDKDKGKDEGARDVKPYPLETCLVTDSKLGSMGDPIAVVHEGQEVKFCCKPCVKKFEKDPAKYIGKLPSEA